MRTYHDVLGIPKSHNRPAPQMVYDIHSITPFMLLAELGLCEIHSVLDIGCGSLGVGRLLIPFLLPGRYYGIDRLQHMIDAGIQNEIGEDMVEIKRPHLAAGETFDLAQFDTKFDFILASSLFCHLPTSQIEKCMGAVKGVLRPDGIFLFSVFWGDADEDWLDGEVTVPRYVTHTPDKIVEIADANGLYLLYLNYDHPTRQAWCACTHPGQDELVPDWILDMSLVSGTLDAPKRTPDRRARPGSRSNNDRFC